MIWQDFSKLKGTHAFLGASKYHWINYDEEKLTLVYKNFLATQKGTELHALASELIRLGVKLPRSKKTLNAYVNDAIGFGMRPEQILYYSQNCYGTADSICFDEQEKLLRIHDLKTGVTPTHMEQLYVYAALFCLQYDVAPGEIDIECRIYQNDDVQIDNPDDGILVPIMDKIISFDKLISKIKSEGGRP